MAKYECSCWCGGTTRACVIYPDHAHCFKCGEQNWKLTKEELELMENNILANNIAQLKTPTTIERGIVTALESRGITKETAEKYGVEKIFNGLNEPVGFAYNQINPETGEIFAQKIKRLNGQGMQWNGNHNDVSLFGKHLIPAGGKYITITEGEEDALAAYQMMKTVSGTFEPAVVSIPDGAGSVEKVCKKDWEYINSFENIIIAFDGDEVGRKAAEKICKLFDYRPKILMFSEAKKDKDGQWLLKDSNDYLKAGRTKDFLNMWWRADRMTPKGVLSMKSLWDFMIKTETNTRVAWPWDGMNKMLHGIITGHLIIIKAGVKVGKCFGKDTPIRMYDGSVKMIQDVHVGDLLMGDDSTPRRVESVITGREQLYKVKQSKKEPYIVNESHILCVKDTVSKEKIDISLKDYLVKAKKHDWKGYSSPIERNIPFNFGNLTPYFLGVWLGDGHAENTAVTNMDPEVIRYLQEYAESCKLSLHTDIDPRNGVLTHRLIGSLGKDNPLREDLRRLGVWNNKHIPKEIILSPMSERLELLAGLIDTDGHLATTGNESQNIEITQKRKALAVDIQTIARSCGFKCSLTETRKGCWYLGEYKIGTYYRVILTGDLERIPCLIKHKQALPWREKHRDPLINGIEIEAIGEGDYYGFVLDSNHRFLLEDFTVVHNTSLLKELAYHIHTASKHNVGIIFLENTKKEIGLGLCAIHMNKPMKPWEIPDDLEGLAKAHAFMSEEDRITIFDPEDSRTAENILAKIMYFVKAHDCRYILLDHISMLAYQSGDDNERRFLDKLLADLKELTTSLDINITAVIHVNDDGKTRGSRAPGQLCDAMINLEREKTSDDPIVKNTTTIIVEENRWGECGTACKLFYDQKTGRMTEMDLEGPMMDRQVKFDD